MKIRAVEVGGEGKRREELVLGKHPDTKSRATWYLTTCGWTAVTNGVENTSELTSLIRKTTGLVWCIRN